MERIRIPDIVLPEEKLAIASLGPEDAQIFFDLIDRNREYFSQKDPSITNSIKGVKDARRRLSASSYFQIQFIGIFVNSELEGCISMMLRWDNKIEIGAFISPEYSKKGFVSIAGKALTGFIFSNTDYTEIFARTREENTAAIKALERNGFARDDTHSKPGTPRFILKKNVYISAHS